MHDQGKLAGICRYEYEHKIANGEEFHLVLGYYTWQKRENDELVDFEFAQIVTSMCSEGRAKAVVNILNTDLALTPGDDDE